MSANRRHTDVPELGFADLADACSRNPILRLQGRVHTMGFRMKRFNRAVRFISLDDDETMTVERVKRDRKTGQWHPTGQFMTIRWDRLDWITWHASGDPNGTWMKVTAVGEANFGRWEVRGTGVLDRETNVYELFADRAEALLAAHAKLGA